MSTHRNEATSDLKWLCEWVESQCDGVWERGITFSMGMYPDPAWRIEVKLKDTSLEGVAFAPVIEGEAKKDGWMSCQLHRTKFLIECDLKRLPDALRVFRTWVEANQKV